MEFARNKATELVLLALMVAEDGLLDGAVLGLYSNDAEITDNNVRGDFTDATYSGNGDEAITWGVPSLSDDGEPEVVGVVGEFRPNAATVGNVIHGAMLLDDADGLLMALPFDDEVNMNGTLDSLILTVRVRVTPGGLGVSVS